MGVSIGSNKGKKNLDFEINLIPFIDLLAACVCFLLLTSVWIQIGSMSVKQAVGGQSAEETKKVPAVWAQMQKDGNVVLKYHDFPSQAVRKLGAQAVVNGKDGQIDFEELKTRVTAILQTVPDLNTGLVLPQGETEYEKVISLMDNLKKSGLSNLGVSPL